MFSISPKQHSKILGFALIGYSWSLFVLALKVLPFLSENLDQISRIHKNEGFTAALTFFYEIISYPIYFLIVLISAISIITFNDKRKFIALIFIPFAINLFPLGSILCLYVLLYLFVISENKTETEITSQIKI